MNRKHLAIISLTLAACLAFTACGAVSDAIKGKAKAIPSGSAMATGSPSAETSATGYSATAAPEGGAPGQSLADAFTTVEKNPLHESIQYALWLAATGEEPADPGAAGGTALKQLADKYLALVADKGVHYVEVNDMMGMNLKTEYWIKGGKFKKVEPDVNKVTIFDGEHYVQYQTDEKKGTRFSKDIMTVSADITMVTRGMLINLAVSPYQQQEDQKIGKFDCGVFYLEMEMMGFKGNTLYVDKETGMLIKNQYGDPKNKKSSMSVTVELFEVGGFGDEVFTVPDDITVEDYQ